MTMATVSPFFIDSFPFLFWRFTVSFGKFWPALHEKFWQNVVCFGWYERGNGEKGVECFPKKINNCYSRCVAAVAAEDECIAE